MAGRRTRRNTTASAQSTVRSDNPEQGMIVPVNGLETTLNNVANMMANIMERLDKALPGPSGIRDIPAGQPRQVLRTASSPILQELHDPEEVERERRAIARRRAEELARNSKVNEDRAKDASQIVGEGNENPRGSVFERISRQKAHRNARGASQVLVRSLRNLEEDEVQSQARVPAQRRLGPPVPEAGEFQDLRQQIQEMQRKINKGRVFTTHASDALMCRCFLQTVDSKVADWVNHIPARSIRTWDELGLRFLEHFAGNCRPKKHFTHLASNDHNTEDCYTLKNEMARLIRRGHLKKFVQDSDAGNPGNAQNGKRKDKEVAQAEARKKRHIGLEDEEEDSEPAPHRQKRHHGCNFIIGGNTGGDSATSRKKWANAAMVNKVLVPEGKKLKTEPIVFSNADLPETGVPHRDALVITVDIMDLLIHKTLVDTGNSVNIMYMDTYKALGLTRDELSPIKIPLTGFTGDSIEPEGVITLPVEIGDTKATRKLDMEFVVVGIISNTNIILGRPGLEDLECVILPRHLCIKFPTPHGVGVARGSLRVSRAWYLKATKQPVKYDTQVGEVTAQLLRAEEKRPRVEVAGDIEEVDLEPGTPGRLVFKAVLGRTMEAYVDDMIVKSKEARDHVRDLEEVFEIMMKVNLRLNPKKSTFAVEGGKFLGHMVSRKGIEANPEKVRAIMEMEPPKTAKEVQRLTGRLAALNRFLSKLAEKAHPFFAVIKKRAAFEWTQECQEAFEELKRYLSSPPVLSKPEPGDVLTLYLAIADCAISTVIVREEHGAQHPVYYISKTLRDAELRYSRPEKAMLAVFWTAKRLTLYFQTHRIVVLTNEPLASLTRSPAASARMTKWAVFISQYNVEFRPCPSIKGQALADFQVECTAREMTRTRVETRVEKDWWVMSIDGSFGSRSCRAGIVLITPEKFRIYYAIRFQFRVSNNEAEYEALINGLKILREFEAKEERMKRYRDLSLEMLGRFEFKLEHIHPAQNAEADVLSKLSAESPEYISKLATVEELVTPSLNSNEVIWVSPDPPEWLDRLAKYIEDGEAPENPEEARLLRMRAPTYQVQDGVLYKRSYNGVLLRCLRAAEAKALLEEIHEGNIPGRPATNYTPISSVIPFSRWGIDIVGALPKGAGQARWIVVAIDYFTKWVEAEPLAGITGRQMIDFVGTNILCRFGVPRQIISDNGTQFEEAEFQDFLKTWGIQHTKVSVAYPQANGQVENVNRTIIDGIKKKLLSEGSKWVDELPRILWTYRTTPRRATGDTPFGLAYGFEARAPAEVKPRAFPVGDDVLRKREKSQPTKGGKLAKKYEGPYIIKAVVRPGTYKLVTPKGKEIDRTWNVEHLVKFYQ
ncbi:unnamed protein product [Cuscuta campestris]|uniref:Integrase catalytic domain-containing protein n=1 Tax=Cuscuta campestris TaxID=132261 RepID=A0A484MLK7_9ASTE|nr:unnamed protein product [Cuscuta campestris]